jgi:predicted lipoprotein with Yx(FWY)xxD motif
MTDTNYLERGVWKIAAVFALLGLVGYLAAFGATAHGAVRAHATVSLRATSLGKVLSASNGHTLYLFMHDKAGKSRCSGQCAAFWPPLTVKVKPTAGTGLKASMIGWTKRSDGKMQVTFNHHPLYFFKLDKKAGQVNGEGVDHFGGLWWAVSAHGLAVKKAMAAPAPTTTSGTTTTTTTTSAGGGGGYGSY